MLQAIQPESIEERSLEYEVIHTIEGRWRIRVPRLIDDSEYASKLKWLFDTFEFAIYVRINCLVGSLVLEYDVCAIAPTQLKEKIGTAIQQAYVIELPVAAAPEQLDQRPEIDWVERLGLPMLGLSLSLLANQLAMPIPAILVGGAVVAAALPFLTRVFETTVKEKRLDADLLDALWISLYTAKGDFVAPALMVSMIESGELLRDVTASASDRQALDLVNSLGEYALVEQDGEERRVPLKEVQIGDRVVVYPGSIIPVSGRILRGKALIDEHKLTGESTLVSRCEGQVVHASTLLVEGKLCVLVKRVGDSTRIGVAFQLMQAAPVHDTRVEDYASKLANAAVLPTLGLSALIFAVTRDFSRAVAPLHLDFSQGIRLSVPTTVISALSYAARNGVYIRSGRALEMLARVDTIVFDKTGTLTQGNPAVVAIRTASDRIDADRVLTVAASAEQTNTHPVADAIVRYAEANGIERQKCEVWDYQIGLGIVAQIAGQRVLVGSDRLMRQEGIELNAFHARYPDITSGNHSLVYVAQDSELLGAILYTDPVRPESHSAVAALKAQRLDIYTLSGDRQRVANEVAEKLGIEPDNTYSSCSPLQKVEIVRQLRDSGCTVAFVGEGINDAAALAYADVSISIASGSDIARETADVLLLDDDLRGLTKAIEIAKRSMDIVYQNTALVAIPNIGVVLAGIFFALNPVLSVIISNGSALLAELNALRPLFDAEDDPIAKISTAKFSNSNTSNDIPDFSPLMATV
ncbi:heavy metal translocating P-type ATPase [Chroococcidiopsis thermalis]|uniref:Heavy metal translocating P-type ATPase n=1 Tax=Chroococcidiopsis thermalis (strain PCC 7203) TaxID=251229 RepID=K9U3A1_CHRTP|nr:heavy metal translocating P-type ATPase [Chroococcidiopsis thermalis]AFY89123.1 heavy metal translocating P-type ATPase [Chroococcidiopsis thermalis PCC 7203]